MKTLVKRVAKAAGYEIKKINDPLWSNTNHDLTPVSDTVITEPWQSLVLDMANRNYRPEILRHRSGPIGDDLRLKYIAYYLDVRGQRILEPGPFEGYHSILLEKMGAREIVSVESRRENFIRCQRV
jgi:hypothetical protein